MCTSNLLRILATGVAITLTLPACGDDASEDAASSDGPSSTTDGTTGTTGTSSSTSTSTSDATGSSGGTSTTAGDTNSETTATDDTSSGMTGSTGAEQLEIIGDWLETYDGGMVVHTITEASWTQDSDFGVSVYLIEDFDNAAHWALGQSDPAQGGDGTYSRFDWTYDDRTVLHYCTAAFLQPTAQDALDAPPADADDLESGCDGFGWSALEPN